MNSDQTDNREDEKPVALVDEALEDVAGGTLISPTTTPTVPTGSTIGGGGGNSTPTGGGGGFTPGGGTLTPSTPNKA
jgi:hypothetical protein